MTLKEDERRGYWEQGDHNQSRSNYIVNVITIAYQWKDKLCTIQWVPTQDAYLHWSWQWWWWSPWFHLAFSQAVIRAKIKQATKARRHQTPHPAPWMPRQTPGGMGQNQRKRPRRRIRLLVLAGRGVCCQWPQRTGPTKHLWFYLPRQVPRRPRACCT